MRRHLVLAAAIAGVLLVTGCSSDSGTKRTVTAVVTVSSGAEVPSDSAASGSADAGSVDPSAATASSATAVSVPASSAAPSPAPSPTAAAPAPFVAVDPLKVDCGAVIAATDVKTIFNNDIPNDRIKVNVAEVNTEVGQVGRVRCFYGLAADKKSGLWSMALTQYTDAAAAQKQVDVTIANETDNGAQIIPTTVNDYPATIAIREGGLIIMAYDTWTMAIATSQAIDPAALAAGLPQLASAALTRVLKT